MSMKNERSSILYSVQSRIPEILELYTENAYTWIMNILTNIKN